MSKLAEAVVTLRMDKTAMARDLLGARRMLMTSIQGMAGMAKGILSRVFSLKTLIGGVVGGMAFRQFITPFARFEEEMDKSMAIMVGAVGMEKEMELKARSVAKRFGRSHEEMARSYFYLASAGLNAQRSLAVYETAAEFATAGSFDMAEATSLLADSVAALGKASQDPAEYGRNMLDLSNLIVKGNSLANTNIQELAEAIQGGAGPAIKSFNLDLEDSIATLLVFADKGLAKGTKAGTYFQILMQQLTKTYWNNKEAFEAMEIEVFDKGTGQVRKFSEIIRDMNRALGQKTPEAISYAITEQLHLEQRLGKIIQSLLGSEDAIERYAVALENRAGESARVAARVLDNLISKWREFKTAIADLTISLNERLAPAWEGIVEVLRTLADQLTMEIEAGGALASFSSWLQDAKQYAEELVAAIKTLGFGEGFGAIGTRIGEDLMAYFDYLVEKLKEAAKAMGEIMADAMLNRLGFPNKKAVAGGGISGAPGYGPAMLPPGYKEMEKKRLAAKAVADAAAGKTAEERLATRLAANRERFLTQEARPFWEQWDIETAARQQRQMRSMMETGYAGTVTRYPSQVVSNESMKSYMKRLASIDPSEFLGGQGGMFGRLQAAVPLLIGAGRAVAGRGGAISFGAQQMMRAAEAQRVIEEGKKKGPAWQRAGIEDMARTIQDAIMDKQEEKRQERIAKATEAAEKTLENILEWFKKNYLPKGADAKAYTENESGAEAGAE